MRTITTFICIIVLLAGGSIASYRYINTTTNSLGAHLETVEQSTYARKWQVAQKELNAAQNQWEKAKGWWTVLLEHQEIDDIDISIRRLDKYIEAQDIPLALGEVSTLKLLLNHINDTEQLNLRNIF